LSECTKPKQGGASTTKTHTNQHKAYMEKHNIPTYNLKLLRAFEHTK
jgi:hypothetical protein